MLEILFPSLNEGKNCKIFLELCQPQTPQLDLEQPNVSAKSSPYLDSSQYRKIFSQSLIKTDIFCSQIFSVTAIGLDIPMDLFEDCIIFLTGQPGFRLKLILSKNKGFHSEAMLKMHPLSPSMKEYGLGIQNVSIFTISKDLSFRK